MRVVGWPARFRRGRCPPAYPARGSPSRQGGRLPLGEGPLVKDLELPALGHRVGVFLPEELLLDEHVDAGRVGGGELPLVELDGPRVLPAAEDEFLFLLALHHGPPHGHGHAEDGGSDVYTKLKYESGVHRVQRVPTTEASGRIHTSTVTVAIMPEADEADIKVEEKDLRIDVFRAGGKGGQGVNTTDSAVRIVHLPTNTVVICQDERSQIKNKAKAMKVLRTRLLDAQREEQDKQRSADRKSKVGTGERNERIRTYNFPQTHNRSPNRIHIKTPFSGNGGRP